MSKNRLKTADIRRAVRKWCHLHKSKSHGLFYARCNDGGMGMMKVRKVVSKMQLGRIYRLSHSTDPITHCIMRRRFGLGKFKRLSLAAKGWLDKVPKWSEYRTGDEVREIAEGNGLNCPRERVWRETEYGRWGRLRSQGIGVL